MERKNQIASFIEQMEGEELQGNAIVLGGSSNGINASYNQGACTNRDMATCYESTNTYGCKNQLGQCGDSHNGGDKLVTCDNALDPLPQPINNQCGCGPIQP